MTDPVVPSEDEPAGMARARHGTGADPLRGMARHIALTRTGIAAERIVHGFWPFWSVALSVVALLAFGVQDVLPLEVLWACGLAVLGALGFTLWQGVRRFRMPARAEAVARMDALLPGRPLAALTDTQAIGSGDAASARVWQAHLARMADRARAARPVQPDLRLSRRDPYGVRYLATIAFAMALLFGSFWRLADVPGPGGGAVLAGATGPSWEAWVEPPAYTGKPGLYLNDIPAGALDLPEGSMFTLRLYGEVGTLTLAETVSGRTGEVGSAADPAQEFKVTRSGTISINGPGGREWQVTARIDAPPKVEIIGAAEVQADGEMALPFHTSDDHGIVAGHAQITLDLAVLDRRFGLIPDPETRDPITADLALPISGSRADFTESFIDNFSEHPWAQMPVKLTLTVEDAAGATGTSEPVSMVLPGRRFFHPLAAALIEMRRDLLWTTANGPRALQILRAATYKPDGYITNERAYLMLRVMMRRLDTAVTAGLTPEARDEFAAALWEIALIVEEGDLADAKARLDRAQERLSEAIRNGASQAEIDQLMQEMQQAMNDYMRQLAEQSERNPDTDTAENQQQMEVTGDQLQQMLDRIQELMEQGRMAEAQELLDALRQMMENMQVTQGEGGEGGPGQQAMNGLGESLREQQGLSDETFQGLQGDQQPGQGQQPGQQGEGRQPGQQGQGQGQPGQSQGRGEQGSTGGQGSLADRQQALRDEIARQRGSLPGAGTAEGDAARGALDRAGRAMEQAEDALRQGNGAGAIDRQADAMDALRDGIRELGAMAQDSQAGTATAQGGVQEGGSDQQGQRDPLGRQLGQMGSLGSDQDTLQGEDVYRRARDLLDEIRRRSGDRARPEAERSYLDRLLERF